MHTKENVGFPIGGESNIKPAPVETPQTQLSLHVLLHKHPVTVATRISIIIDVLLLAPLSQPSQPSLRGSQIDNRFNND